MFMLQENSISRNAKPTPNNKELIFQIQNLEFPPYEMDKWSIGRTYLKKHEEEKPPICNTETSKKRSRCIHIYIYIYIPWK